MHMYTPSYTHITTQSTKYYTSSSHIIQTKHRYIRSHLHIQLDVRMLKFTLLTIPVQTSSLVFGMTSFAV